MDWTLEVVVLPVSDLARSIAFYRDQVGFALDHETENEHMHVAQLTPTGSGCSIVIGNLPSQNQMEPGSMHGLQLVVADAAAAREERSAAVSRPARSRSSTSATAARLRVQRPRRQHLGGAAAQGAWRQAADPARPPGPLRRVGRVAVSAPGSRPRPGRPRRRSRSRPAGALLGQQLGERGDDPSAGGGERVTGRQ